MNFLRIKLVFSLLVLYSSLFASSTDCITCPDNILTPSRQAPCTKEATNISLCKSEIDSLTVFLHLTYNTLKNLLSSNVKDAAYNLPAKQLLNEYSNIKNILIKLNNGEKFHPTPESDRIIQRHIAAISELSHAEFQQGSPENYMNNLNHPYGSALFPTPYDHTAILTPEWLTLGSILHDDNFERSLDHSPHSPSGIANWHHAFQTHDVVHLIARSVHKEHHGDLHPITTNSQIDRQEFNCERLRLNQAWALLATIRSIAKALIKHSTNNKQDTFLTECSSLYSSSNSSRELTPDPISNRNLFDEYDDEAENDDDQCIYVTQLSTTKKLSSNMLQKKKYAKSANKNKHTNNLNQNLKDNKKLRKNL